ncbi:hypothetical protein NW739_00230 [Mycoplasmopsis felis]|nr:hypothetical protein [Mycoplasmopsis felis]MCU9939276.1 hypothetical protein [Mycoplasmopsis felis]
MDLLKQINGVDQQGNANTTYPESSLSTQDLEDIKAVAQSQRTQEENNLEKSKESAREELLKITDTNITDGKGDFARRIDNARTQAEVQAIIAEINAQLENSKNQALELKDKLEPKQPSSFRYWSINKSIWTRQHPKSSWMRCIKNQSRTRNTKIKKSRYNCC